jgi:hypothetical protein
MRRFGLPALADAVRKVARLKSDAKGRIDKRMRSGAMIAG